MRRTIELQVQGEITGAPNPHTFTLDAGPEPVTEQHLFLWAIPESPGISGATLTISAYELGQTSWPNVPKGCTVLSPDLSEECREDLFSSGLVRPLTWEDGTERTFLASDGTEHLIVQVDLDLLREYDPDGVSYYEEAYEASLEEDREDDYER